MKKNHWVCFAVFMGDCLIQKNKHWWSCADPHGPGLGAACGPWERCGNVFFGVGNHLGSGSWKESSKIGHETVAWDFLIHNWRCIHFPFDGSDMFHFQFPFCSDDPPMTQNASTSIRNHLTFCSSLQVTAPFRWWFKWNAPRGGLSLSSVLSYASR